ncbi:MAG TPA: hypothetical protein VIM70_02080 [Clostridium sp.]|uniref:lysoplasmalogenase family protein n=1 Tax=Clostridium sp. TaxID=1506 RepID=UPI002F954986
MKNRGFFILLTKVVVGIVIILYIFFLYLDFYKKKIFISSEYIKYVCILLCFLLSVIATKDLLADTDKDIANHRDILLLQLAMFITVLADLCLIFFGFFILGVALFSLVQITYCARYTTKKLKATLLNFFIVFLCVVLICVLASLFIEGINILITVSLFYVITLLNSIIKAVGAFKNNLYSSPSKYMIVLGMMLFLLCDICVALLAITALFPSYFMSRFQQITFFSIWFFYIPSQLLLSLSGGNKILETKSFK